MEKILYLFQLSVLFEKMKDPDIADTTEARDVIGFYEWALGDNVGKKTKQKSISEIIYKAMICSAGLKTLVCIIKNNMVVCSKRLKHCPSIVSTPCMP
jgi:hypothetical protein